jgi:hypothetical protein
LRCATAGDERHLNVTGIIAPLDLLVRRRRRTARVWHTSGPGLTLAARRVAGGKTQFIALDAATRFTARGSRLGAGSSRCRPRGERPPSSSRPAVHGDGDRRHADARPPHWSPVVSEQTRRARCSTDQTRPSLRPARYGNTGGMARSMRSRSTRERPRARLVPRREWARGAREGGRGDQARASLVLSASRSERPVSD